VIYVFVSIISVDAPTIFFVLNRSEKRALGKLARKSWLCYHCGERTPRVERFHANGDSYLLVHLAYVKCEISGELSDLVRCHFEHECYADQVLVNPKVVSLEADGFILYDHSPDQPRRYAYFDERPPVGQEDSFEVA
jgi:hypothetical protein